MAMQKLNLGTFLKTIRASSQLTDKNGKEQRALTNLLKQAHQEPLTTLSEGPLVSWAMKGLFRTRHGVY